MKKIILILLFSLFFISGVSYAAEVIFAPDEYPYPEKEATFEESVDYIIEASKYFNSKYPDEKIEEDMSEDVSRFFPDLTQQQNENMQHYIRKGLTFYRYLYGLYQKYQASLLVPETPPMVLEDSEYADAQDDREYIETESGGIVISDIKTIVPYSNSVRDLKSVLAKFQKDVDENRKTFDGLVNTFAKLEWKKIPFYDLLYPSPFSGMRGIGDWSTVDDARVRIISEYGNAKGVDKIKGMVDIVVSPHKYIVANEGQYSKPQISFEGSENLKNWEVFLPLPTRIITPDNIDKSVYLYKVSVPVVFYPEDTDMPLHIKSDVNFYVCDKEYKCENTHFSPELIVDNNGVENSAVETFVYQQHLNIIQENSQILQVDDYAVKAISEGLQVLEVSVKSKKKINNLSIYISNANKIVFENPRIEIDGKKAIIRFLPVDKDAKLDNQEFEITFVVNNKNYYYFKDKAILQDVSLPQAPKINLKLILFGVLGGLLLNFMPCVFPVLAIKIFSLTKFGAIRPKNVRRNFFYTISGILLSFLLLATFLALLKYAGISVGWGMQFQNPYFIVSITFAVLVFWLMVCGAIKLPSFQPKTVVSGKADKIIYFLTGSLAVLMSTPCTAPYLGTAIGFALSGDIANIYVIIMSVAFGLSLPYIIFCVFPQFMQIMPPPGPWMQTLNRIMGFMLLLTIFWLFSIMLPQTNIYFAVRLGFYLVFTAILIWFNSLNNEMEYDKSEKLNKYVQKRIKIFLLGFVALFYVVALVDGKMAYKNHYSKLHTSTHYDETLEKIDQYVKEGKTVFVSVGADWCLTCHYNNFTTLNLPTFQTVLSSLNVETVNIDWTNYNKEVLEFMKKHRRSGLPFYIVFSPLAPDGFVLPEILQVNELERIIKTFTLNRSKT